MPWSQAARLASSPRFEKLREGFQRVLGHVVFDALGIGFGGLAGDAKRAQHIDHQAMPQPHALGQRTAFFGQKHAAVRTRGGEAGALEPRDGFDRGGMGDAEPARNIGRPGLALAFKQVGDELDVIFVQRARLRRARLAEAPRLGSFGWQLTDVLPK